MLPACAGHMMPCTSCNMAACSAYAGQNFGTLLHSPGTSAKSWPNTFLLGRTTDCPHQNLSVVLGKELPHVLCKRVGLLQCSEVAACTI